MIEIIISIAIFSVLIIPVSELMFKTRKYANYGLQIASCGFMGRSIMEYIKKEDIHVIKDAISKHGSPVALYYVLSKDEIIDIKKYDYCAKADDGEEIGALMSKLPRYAMEPNKNYIVRIVLSDDSENSIMLICTTIWNIYLGDISRANFVSLRSY